MFQNSTGVARLYEGRKSERVHESNRGFHSKRRNIVLVSKTELRSSSY